MSGEAPARGRVSLAALLLVAGAALALLLPRLGHNELRAEEGRRLLPALEMSASGELVVPTLFGRPYLAKPPGMYWAAALAARARGAFDPLAVRLVSALATALTAAGVLLVGARLVGGRAALFAALAFLVAPEVATKGRLGEIEALFELAVFAATAAWLAPRAGASTLARALPTGLLLGLALLVKGPPALLFFLGAPLGLALARRRARELAGPALGLALLVAAAVAGAWVALLLRRLGGEEAWAVWAGELSEQGASARPYLVQRLEYLAGTALAFAPASLAALPFLVGLARRRGAAPALLAEPAFRAVLATAATGWFLLLWYPGTAPRYALPAAPWIALAFGAYLDAALRSGAWSAGGALRWSARAVGLLGVVAGPALLCAGGELVPGLVLGPPGVAACVAATAAGLATLALSRRARPLPALGAAWLALALLVFLQETRVAATSARKHEHARVAAELEGLVPPDAPLFVVSWSDFNTLAYVDRELRWSGPDDPLPSGARVLVPKDRAEELAARADARRLGGARDARGRALEVWRVEAPAPPRADASGE